MPGRVRRARLGRRTETINGGSRSVTCSVNQRQLLRAIDLISEDQAYQRLPWKGTCLPPSPCRGHLRSHINPNCIMKNHTHIISHTRLRMHGAGSLSYWPAIAIALNFRSFYKRACISPWNDLFSAVVITPDLEFPGQKTLWCIPR